MIIFLNLAAKMYNFRPFCPNFHLNIYKIYNCWKKKTYYFYININIIIHICFNYEPKLTYVIFSCHARINFCSFQFFSLVEVSFILFEKRKFSLKYERACKHKARLYIFNTRILEWRRKIFYRNFRHEICMLQDFILNYFSSCKE